MRRITWMVAIVMCLSVFLAGCGKKDAGSVVKDLDHVISKLDSYQGVGKMVLYTGQQPQEYFVEVWYQKPHYYRISLTNDSKDITQIVLRNDEGVFVLTPHLNKSFRFQSDWPENQGQVYLYQSLVKSILTDRDRQFTKESGSYVFDVLANYQNAALARQKIWLDPKSYAPKHVEVADGNGNVLVKVDFTQFEFGKKFEKDSFDMQRNMTSWRIQSLPTAVSGDGKDAAAQSAGASSQPAGGKDDATGQAAAAQQDQAAKGAQASQPSGTAATPPTGAAATQQPGTSSSQPAGTAATQQPGTAATQPSGTAATQQSNAGSANASASAQAGATSAASSAQKRFGVIEPGYTPAGVKKQDMKDIKLGDQPAVMLRYSGKYNYTLVELNPTEQSVSWQPGDIWDLGFTLGVVTGDDLKTLTWTNDGVEFRLSTGDLPEEEMIKVAQAVQDEMGK